MSEQREIETLISKEAFRTGNTFMSAMNQLDIFDEIVEVTRHGQAERFQVQMRGMWSRSGY
jgi:hypothetical protein